MKTIYDYAFTTCHSLKSVDLTNVEKIGFGTFQLCISLAEVTVPGTIKNIPDHAFHGCSDVNILVFEDGVTSIDEDAALNMYSLDEIVIPESVTSIGDYALGFTYYHPDYTRLDLTIVGYSKSAAEEYANRYGFNFRSIDIVLVPYTTTCTTTITTTTTTTTSATTTTTPSTPPITTEPVFILGDVNANGSVDSSDASAVLAEYAKIQTGEGTSFTDSQKIAADVNKDGVIDSSDASKILSYYSMISTGKEPNWD